MYNCLKAIQKCNDKDKFALFNLSTIKPLDKKIIKKKLSKFKKIITVEDHTVEGGIGSAIAEVMSNTNSKNNILMIGITDKFINSDTPSNLEKKFGLNIDGLAKIFKKI